MFQKNAEHYRNSMEQLRYACNVLGNPIKLTGDVSVEIPVFSFLSVVFQCWEADDEFPANLKFMYDKNILDFMHFETVYFMTSHILSRLEEIADDYGEQGGV